MKDHNISGNINKENILYNNIIYKDKKFNMILNYANACKSDKISYFCGLHRTTQDSNETTKNNKKSLYLNVTQELFI